MVSEWLLCLWMDIKANMGLGRWLSGWGHEDLSFTLQHPCTSQIWLLVLITLSLGGQRKSYWKLATQPASCIYELLKKRSPFKATRQREQRKTSTTSCPYLGTQGQTHMHMSFVGGGVYNKQARQFILQTKLLLLYISCRLVVKGVEIGSDTTIWSSPDTACLPVCLGHIAVTLISFRFSNLRTYLNMNVTATTTTNSNEPDINVLKMLRS